MVPGESMKAVILAAGLSRRFGDFKPLFPLFGIPIIEHTIYGLRSMGIKEIIVVYNKKELKEHLKKKFDGIKFIFNPHPERENGYSLYLAREHVDGPFILVMADHYLSDEFFKPRKFKSTTIFVSEYCDEPDEATKVKVEGTHVVDIGKELKDYEYYDTGLFYCTPEIFHVAEELLKQEKVKLSDIMKRLASRGKLRYEIVQGFWVDIDIPEKLKLVEKEIEREMIKGEDGYIARNINRKISIRITKSLAKYRWATPNILTAISLLSGILSAFLFFIHHLILAGLLTQFTSIIDGCDGEMARLKKMQSRFGAAFDALSDRYVDTLIMLALLFNTPLDYLSIILFFLAATGVILFSYTWHMTGVRIKAGGRDVRLFLIFLVSILTPFIPWISLFLLAVIGLLTHGCAILSLLKTWR